MPPKRRLRHERSLDGAWGLSVVGWVRVQVHDLRYDREALSRPSQAAGALSAPEIYFVSFMFAFAV